MDVFQVFHKLWPSGQSIGNSLDLNPIGVSSLPSRTADKFLSDGTQTYEFLFWNTGTRNQQTQRPMEFHRWRLGLLASDSMVRDSRQWPPEMRVRVDPFTLRATRRLLVKVLRFQTAAHMRREPSPSTETITKSVRPTDPSSSTHRNPFAGLQFGVCDRARVNIDNTWGAGLLHLPAAGSHY